MKPLELIEILKTMNPDLEVKIDTEGYPLSIEFLEEDEDVDGVTKIIVIKG